MLVLIKIIYFYHSCSVCIQVVCIVSAFHPSKHAVNGELECYSTATDRCNFESHKLNTSFESSADCCLGNGYWYKLNGSNECVQCIGKQGSISCDCGVLL